MTAERMTIQLSETAEIHEEARRLKVTDRDLEVAE